MKEGYLEDKLKNVRRVFNINRLDSIEIDNSYISKYYKVNQIPYSVLHTKSDLIYMGNQ